MNVILGHSKSSKMAGGGDFLAIVLRLPRMTITDSLAAVAPAGSRFRVRRARKNEGRTNWSVPVRDHGHQLHSTFRFQALHADQLETRLGGAVRAMG